MVTYKITGEYIQLIQLLKVLNWVAHGGEAQAVVSAGMVKYNGRVDYRKRLKLRPGDVVEYQGNLVQLLG
ncbi:RNA-binding S4 domain-containing protein [Parapedobacter deserti]|uniref:RNA-binding S4 domain-containing protein n=1 Tax=Parapedobacter deserti TaxID=1912957 RepID=A0ABV7JNS8_9SPHI